MKIERDWFRNYLKKQLPSALVMAGLWLVLQISACLGWRHFLLSPLYFVSGALAGLEGGSVLGGVLGRTLLLLFLQEGLRTPVSYTHLDVYKRQRIYSRGQERRIKN